MFWGFFKHRFLNRHMLSYVVNWPQSVFQNQMVICLRSHFIIREHSLAALTGLDLPAISTLKLGVYKCAQYLFLWKQV